MMCTENPVKFCVIGVEQPDTSELKKREKCKEDYEIIGMF